MPMYVFTCMDIGSAVKFRDNTVLIWMWFVRGLLGVAGSCSSKYQRYTARFTVYETYVLYLQLIMKRKCSCVHWSLQPVLQVLAEKFPPQRIRFLGYFVVAQLKRQFFLAFFVCNHKCAKLLVDYNRRLCQNNHDLVSIVNRSRSTLRKSTLL